MTGLTDVICNGPGDIDHTYLSPSLVTRPVLPKEEGLGRWLNSSCHVQMQNPNEDTEWNDVLRSKGILPPKPKGEVTLDEETVVQVGEVSTWHLRLSLCVSLAFEALSLCFSGI